MNPELREGWRGGRLIEIVQVLQYEHHKTEEEKKVLGSLIHLPFIRVSDYKDRSDLCPIFLKYIACFLLILKEY